MHSTPIYLGQYGKPSLSLSMWKLTPLKFLVFSNPTLFSTSKLSLCSLDFRPSIGTLHHSHLSRSSAHFLVRTFILETLLPLRLTDTALPPHITRSGGVVALFWLHFNESRLFSIILWKMSQSLKLWPQIFAVIILEDFTIHKAMCWLFSSSSSVPFCHYLSYLYLWSHLNIIINGNSTSSIMQSSGCHAPSAGFLLFFQLITPTEQTPKIINPPRDSNSLTLPLFSISTSSCPQFL